ncbi:LamG domain-containing protein [Propionispora vibrioides]|jgi:hypothetical protein|uniref:Fibronectin type III domain-containing protein n=1 Tax=Propionispora vibrioides TaxID=112903 RepID=A0A1H8SVP1_9FIRM|nr:LamG domain-containing protein [Propionispora vibrioides]SEO82732.1 Fibronectin type III domain-containing protein [Propionispora vibrioides]
MAYEVDQNTVSLLHFDDGIKDACGNTWTAYGGAATSNLQSEFGNSSLYLNGSGQYLTTPSLTSFGTHDWTIDFWVYPITNSYFNGLFCSGGKSSPYWTSTLYTFMIDCPDSTHMSLEYTNAIQKTIVLLKFPITQNVMQHIAFVRNGTNLLAFVEGKLVASATIDATMQFNSDGVYVLGKQDIRNQYYFNGYIDEFRISNIARWTADFTPPGTVVLPNVPTNLTATPGDSQVTLNWDVVTGATGYNVKRSLTAGGPYETIVTNVSGTSYVDINVVNGTTYYYVVTTVNANGESVNSNEASATPQAVENPPSSGKALLRVTMIDSSEREYRLDKTEIDGFVNWYIRTIGTGISCYSVNDIVDSSKEYLSFEKIISFKVIPLSAE